MGMSDGDFDETGPLTIGSNGDRDPVTGRWVRGNPGGPGSRVSRYAREMHERLAEVVHKKATTERLEAVVEKLLELAEGGDVTAIRLVLERVAPINDALAIRIANLELSIAGDQ
jgi:hypothetical protein